MYDLSNEGFDNKPAHLAALKRWADPATRGRLTVAEFAKRHGVQHGRVRQLLSAGRIAFERGERGRIWIAEDTLYPESLRLGASFRSGEPDPSVRSPRWTDFTFDGGKAFTGPENLMAYCSHYGIAYPAAGA